MANPVPRKWQVVLLLIAALVLWAIDQKRESPSAKPTSTQAPATTGAYELFSGCRLEEHRQNDGDSFRVRLPDGRVEQFRLYYVDAPESEFRSYSGGRNNRERIHEQAEDFGVSDKQAVAIGKKAKSLVHDLLSRGTFTLHTRWDDPFGDRRYHAFITPAGGPMLEETLVKEGLARIHTKPADLPDGTPVKARLKKLRDLETEAKRSKRGAWALISR
jgi:endonuclease YncB( thermonuclease family)